MISVIMALVYIFSQANLRYTKISQSLYYFYTSSQIILTVMQVILIILFF